MELTISTKYADLIVGATHTVIKECYDGACLSVGGKPFWVPNWALALPAIDEDED